MALAVFGLSAGNAAAAEAARRAPLFAAADAEGLVLATLLDYQVGQTNRDLHRLERSWNMSATDRSLVLASWRACEQLSTRVRIDDIQVKGDLATVEFEQQIDARCGGAEESRRQRLRAVLGRSGGGWSIARISSVSPARVTRPGTGGPQRMTALETLSRYGAALESCDLRALSQEWLMTRGDRQMVESLCSVGGLARVSIVQREIAIDGDQGRIDFEQVIDRGASAPLARASLRASLVRRGDGEWTIWRMRERSH